MNLSFFLSLLVVKEVFFFFNSYKILRSFFSTTWNFYELIHAYSHVATNTLIQPFTRPSEHRTLLEFSIAKKKKKTWLCQKITSLKPGNWRQKKAGKVSY
ncbi:unnamed protein product [Coffea canephora]|uniref:Uncharacterized protein n=1 Tax=Coffea canephora TaxID=49390 RepID=A0A068TYA1_COFCA|nr:unnamed protein product [Coffea canephora]